MRKVLLIPLFILFTLFTGDFIFVTNHASADCCMCGTCKWGCTCRGTTEACPKCAFPDTPMVRQVRQPLSQFFSGTITSNLLHQLAARRECQHTILRLTLLEERYQAFNEQAFLVSSIPSMQRRAFNTVVAAVN